MSNKIQLFCFPYAGGTADFFNIIESDLRDIELIKFEYAGRGSRNKERFYSDFQELADDLFSQLVDKLDGEYALFGYSMGCISVIEVLRRILMADMPLPKHIFLAAHDPYTRGALINLSEAEINEWVKERTLKYGDIPESLINNRVFWRTYLPIYRADYTIIGKYNFEELKIKTQIPVTIFYSETDTPISKMKAWEKYFTGSVEYEKYDGNHFFIREHSKEIADTINMRLKVKR